MKEMRLSSFNTIIFGDKELLFDEFFIKLNDNLGDDYSVCYEEDTNRFKVIFDGVEYFLVLDKITMDNYKFGNYSNFTRQLNQIVERTKEMEEENNDDEKVRLEKEKIIEDAKNGLIPNDKARRVYLEYLKDNRKFSFSKIKSYFSNIKCDLLKSYDLMDDWILDTKIWPFNQMWEGLMYFLWGLLISSCIGAAVGYGLTVLEAVKGINPYEAKYLKWMLLSFLPQTTYLVPMTKFIGFQVKQRFSRLINYGRNKRLTKYKIEQLSEELKRGSIEDKTFKTFDNTLPEPIKEQTKSFKDPVLGNLDAILNRLQYINPTEREVLRAEVKRIAEKYKGRLEEFRKQRLDESSQIVLSLDNNSYISIINDIIPEINALEQRMNQIRNYDVEKEQFDDEYLQLMDAIDNCSNAGDIVIGGVQSRAKRKPEQQ